jgi:O-antigen/teichoic acid export membrane protein
MSTVRRVAKNAAVLYIAQLVSTLLGVFLSIAIARRLGDVTFGEYSFAVAFTMLFAILLDMGFSTLIIRNVARDKSMTSKYLGNIVIIKAVLAIVVFGLIALSINVMGYPHDTTTVVLIFGVFVILEAFAEICRGIFVAFERMEYVAVVSIMCRLITVSLGLAALFSGYGLIEIALAFVIGGVFDVLLSFFICVRRFAKPKIEVDLDFWKRAIKAALPIAFLAIASIIFVRIDTVMLSAMKGNAVVGWYNAAYNLVLSFEFIPRIFLTAVFPTMSISFVSSLSSLKASYERSLRYLFILSLPIAVGTTLLADRIIPLVYGDEFSDSIIALRILAWDILLFFLRFALGSLLIAMEKQNHMALACGACAITNVVLNLILIPHFSYIGAGIATIVTETILLGLYFYFVSKHLYRVSVHKIIVKPLVASAIMALFVYSCNGISLALLIALSAVVYFALLYFLKEFRSEDFATLREVIKGIERLKRRGANKKPSS